MLPTRCAGPTAAFSAVNGCCSHISAAMSAQTYQILVVSMSVPSLSQLQQSYHACFD